MFIPQVFDVFGLNGCTELGLLNIPWGFPKLNVGWEANLFNVSLLIIPYYEFLVSSFYFALITELIEVCGLLLLGGRQIIFFDFN